MTMSGSNRHEILVIVLRSSVCKALTVLPQRCVSRAYSGRRLIAFSEVRTIHRTGSNPHTGSGNECPLYPRKRTSEPARVRRSNSGLAILAAIRRASSFVSSLAADRAPRLRRRGAVAPDIDAADVETAVGFRHRRDHREGRPGFDRVHVGDFISHNRHVRCDDDFFSPSLYLTVMTGPSTPATL